MAVRLKDIAKELGVSTVTVSKVLRGNPDIGERTRTLVLNRMKELDYQPNRMAQGLASGRSHAVGLIVPDLVHPFFGEFARALSGALRASGRALVIASSEEDPEIERQEIRTLLSRGIDVLLVASCQTEVAEGGLRMGTGGTPLVLVDRNFAEPGASFVGSDDVAVGRLATEHLLGLGRRRIAHIGGEGMSPSVDRLRGYRAALEAAEVPARAEYVVTRARFEETGDLAGYQAMQELLALPERPDAVFCYNDLSAIGAMKAATEARLRIPEDIAFVGCGNLRYAEYLKIPLTSMDHSTEQMGQVAAEMSLELAAGRGGAPRTRILEPRLVVRESSVQQRAVDGGA